jgi:hypothetical protein
MTTPLVTAWSYSRYADYTRCPLFFKLKHLDRSLKDEGSAAMNRGSTIHKLAEDYVLGKLKKMPPELANFKDQFNELKALRPMVEQNWGFRNDWSWTGKPGWFGDEVWFRAKCDVAIKYEDNTAEVIDHKTGRKYGSNTDQVELFGASVFTRFPGVTDVTVRLWYLDIADHTENEDTLDLTAADGVRIRKDWDKRVRPMFNDRKFAPKPNDKCKWCPASNANGGTCKF